MAISPKFITDLAQREVVVVSAETTLGNAVQKMVDAQFDERRAFLVVKPASGNDFRACVFGQLNERVIQWLGAASFDQKLNQLPIPAAARVLAVNTTEETSGGANNWLKQHPSAILIVYDDAGNVYLFYNVNMSDPGLGGTALTIIHGEKTKLSEDKRVDLNQKYPPATCPHCHSGTAIYDTKSGHYICNNTTCAKVIG